MWALEYSKSQDCFHVDKLSRIIQINKSAIGSDRWNDYRIIGIFDDVQQAHEEAERLRVRHGMGESKV